MDRRRIFFGAKRLFVERDRCINAFNNDVRRDAVKACWYRVDAHENSPLALLSAPS
jgi:hypothetical protein